jgi:hypothetical protein
MRPMRYSCMLKVCSFISRWHTFIIHLKSSAFTISLRSSRQNFQLPGERISWEHNSSDEKRLVCNLIDTRNAAMSTWTTVLLLLLLLFFQIASSTETVYDHPQYLTTSHFFERRRKLPLLFWGRFVMLSHIAQLHEIEEHHCSTACKRFIHPREPLMYCQDSYLPCQLNLRDKNIKLKFNTMYKKHCSETSFQLQGPPFLARVQHNSLADLALSSGDKLH